MGLRKLKFCKSCKRKFTPMNQPVAQAKAPVSTGATVRDLIGLEAPIPAGPEPQTPVLPETAASAEPENPSDEHRNLRL